MWIIGLRPASIAGSTSSSLAALWPAAGTMSNATKRWVSSRVPGMAGAYVMILITPWYCTGCSGVPASGLRKCTMNACPAWTSLSAAPHEISTRADLSSLTSQGRQIGKRGAAARCQEDSSARFFSIYMRLYWSWATGGKRKAVNGVLSSPNCIIEALHQTARRRKTDLETRFPQLCRAPSRCWSHGCGVPCCTRWPKAS